MSKFVPAIVVSLRNFTGEAIATEYVRARDVDNLTIYEQNALRIAVAELTESIGVGDTITVEAIETEIN